MVRLIKRYGGGSRKLYDTEESRYVSLDEVATWIRAGQELRVVDSATDDDVTAQTLAQIIYEDHKSGQAMLSTDLLHDVIRRGGRALAQKVERVQAGVDRLVRASVDRIAPGNGVHSELELLRARLAELEESLAELEEVPPARKPRAPRRKRR
jgi:polyhydroxyalkanoate synthesis repressor PhaR